MRDMIHVDLIGKNINSIRQQNLGGATIKRSVSLTCMTIIYPAMGWIEMIKVPMFDLYEITGVNDEYIDKSSFRVSQLFNTTWIYIYLRTRKVVFDNGYEFKKDFTSLIKDLYIKHVLTTI